MFSVRFLRDISNYQRPEEAIRFLRQDRYWRPEVAEALLARVEKLAPLKPKQALGLAELAVELVQRMRDPSQEIRAHARCSLALSQRMAGDLKAAAHNFSQAEELSANCSPSARAMVARQKALLLLEQGQSDEAVQLALKAIRLDEEGGTSPNKSISIEGIIRYFRQEYDRSVQCWRKVLSTEDPKSDDYLFATQNLAATLIKQDISARQIVEVRKFLKDVQDRIRGIRETQVRYILWYTEGMLHALMEEFRMAAEHFLQARNGFLKLELFTDYANASVEMIDALARRGDTEKAVVAIERTAKELAGREGYERAAEVFRLAQAEVVAEAAEFIRSRLPAALVRERSAS